jgi:modification methylase
MKTFHKIIIGDSRYMKEVPNESVHLIITSPPYWQLKDYGNSQQIGFDNNYEDYINNLNRNSSRDMIIRFKIFNLKKIKKII